VPGKVEAVDYKEALRKIKVLKNELVKKLDGLDRSKGEYLSLSIYASCHLCPRAVNLLTK